jgi:glucan phosphoethanolaminetransferase (alkaline phosphatase superfamily)
MPMLGICIILVIARPFNFLSFSHGKSTFIPNGVKFTLENSIQTFWGYLTLLLRENKPQNYKPYTIEKTKSADTNAKPITIVYIIGESMNAGHMSLFGYKINTTPLLNKLAQSDDFYCTIGIAGSVTTISSCKFICNVIREPNNSLQTSLGTTNIFKLAKNSGFKTFYISAQQDDLLAYIGGVQHIDVLITREQYPSQFSQKRDSFLLELLDQQSFAEKNLVIIHQRCIHSPYQKTLPRGYWESSVKRHTHSKNPLINQYDDAVLYVDSIIANLFNKFNKTNGRFYIFWASDHNELLGNYDGLYGHGHLTPLCAQIPMMIQSNDTQFLKLIKRTFALTHYDICEAITNLLGYKITNPNQEGGVYYINGVDHNGRCGYIRFKKDYKNKKVQYSDVLFDE